MSRYVSAAAFLSDVRLRLDAFSKDKLGILVVEGPDDRRLFFRHVPVVSQIVPAGGRRNLLTAYAETSPADRERMVFLTDCDYEVRRGTLQAAPGLVITEGTDIEADLIDLGLLYGIVGELVPQALGSAERITEITETVLRDAIAMARPLGRIRMAAQPYGVPLELENIRHRRYWSGHTKPTLDMDKLIRTTHQKIRKENNITLDKWSALIEQMPTDDKMCHGKDLLRAFRFILDTKYNLGNDVDDVTIPRLLRSNLWPYHLEQWQVAQRIRRWEDRTGRRILRRAAGM